MTPPIIVAAPRAQRDRSPCAGGVRSDGFTLVELILVMLIIGILGGILILTFEPFQSLADDQDDAIVDAQGWIDCDAVPEQCAAPPPPPALPQPPQVDSLALTLDAGPAAAGSDAAVSITVAGSDGAPFPGAEVRVEITGANPRTLDLISDGAGSASFSYEGSSAGWDQVTACTGAFGALPEDCATADGGSSSAERLWLVPPVPTAATQTHDEDDGSRVVVAWDRPIQPASGASAANYTLHDSQAACLDDTQPGDQQGASRNAFDTTLLQITFNGDWPHDEPRWLRVDDDTETDAFDIPNQPTCLQVGSL